MQNQRNSTINTNHAIWRRKPSVESFSARATPTPQEEPFHNACPPMANSNPAEMVVGMGQAWLAWRERSFFAAGEGSVDQFDSGRIRPLLSKSTHLASASSER